MAAASFDEADWAAVESHDTVGYLLSAPMMRELAFDTSRRLLAATAALLRSGATAVKNESSGITHGRDRWLALAERSGRHHGRECGRRHGRERGRRHADESVAASRTRAWPRARRRLGEAADLRRPGALQLRHAPARRPRGRDRGRRGASDEGQLPELVAQLETLAIYLVSDPRAAEIEDGAGFRMSRGRPPLGAAHRHVRPLRRGRPVLQPVRIRPGLTPSAATGRPRHR